MEMDSLIALGGVIIVWVCGLLIGILIGRDIYKEK